MYLSSILPLLTFLQILSLSRLVLSQSSIPPAVAQSSTFNSTFALSADQIAKANLTAEDANRLNTIINFQRSQYAGGPTTEDPFYIPPFSLNSSTQPPGTILRVEDFTNLTYYSLPPNLALSRILYTSSNFNGSTVPASAFILWPFAPRRFTSLKGNEAPVVIWDHMTEGSFGPNAPSKHRVLWAGDSAHFALALDGYAVIAPDYAGLGVSQDASGNPIQHEYLIGSASAKDTVYAFKAARSAFPDRLSKQYVVIGQSQGGGVAWSTAELLANSTNLADGYLGAIAVGPTTDPLYDSASAAVFVGIVVSLYLKSIFPSFSLTDWLTPLGVARANLFQQIQGDFGPGLALFNSQTPLVQEGYLDTWSAKAFSSFSYSGRKATTGPLLIIQGSQDPLIDGTYLANVINDTCTRYPQNQIEYLISNGTGHVTSLYATRSTWLDWIQDRFLGKPVGKQECGRQRTFENFLPYERYQATGNSYIQWAGAPEYAYEVPLSA
ncbi:MAG: hypothetical protein Q9167_003307 [Letrouitia subvulpina]